MGTGRNTGNTGERMRLTATIMQAVFSAVGQPAEIGALPTLMAATADLPGLDVRRPERAGSSSRATPGSSAPAGWRTTARPSDGCGSSARRPPACRFLDAMTMPLLRPITPADHADVLALNERNVELLAPIDEARLVELRRLRPSTPASSTSTAPSPAS